MAADSDAEDKPVLVQTSLPDRGLAKTIAAALVERHLAAAVHIMEIASVYRWRGEIRQDGEFVLTAKTQAARFAEIEAAIDELHPYELPPVIQIDIDRTTPAYADWIAENASGEG